MEEIPDGLFEKVKCKKGKELNLFVGLLYTLSVKSMKYGLLTYEEDPRVEESCSNLLQIAWRNPDDYEAEGIHRDRALWTILPAESEDGENNYVLKVLGFPEGILTYSHGLSWGGRYIELDLKHPKYYQPGGTMHSSTMWNFDSTELADHFTIHNSDPRRNPNFVTFSNEISTDGQLVQIGTKDIDCYQTKGIFRNDALWGFNPAEYVLNAEVLNFRFDLISEQELKEMSTPLRIFEESIFLTESEDVGQSCEEISRERTLKESFHCCFLTSFKIFSDKNITIHCDFLKHLKSAPSESESELQFEKFSNTQWISSRERKLIFTNEGYKIGTGNREIRLTGYSDWVHKLEIPFTADVAIKAASTVAVRTNNNHELDKVFGEIRNTDVIKQLLKCERFSGKIVTDPKPNKSQGNIVKCSVSGVLKCSFSLDTTLEVTEVNND